MAFPSNPGAIPNMNPNAGMSDQEQQMVKAVRPLRSPHRKAQKPSTADLPRRCKQAWKAAWAKPSWRA
jgi:hypothetical protein